MNASVKSCKSYPYLRHCSFFQKLGKANHTRFYNSNSKNSDHIHSAHGRNMFPSSRYVSSFVPAKESSEKNDRQKNHHVVILGSGIVGLSSAHFLLARNNTNSESNGESRIFRVTLIDQHPKVAMGTSKKNGELLCPSLTGCWTDMPLFFGNGALFSAHNFFQSFWRASKEIRPIQFHSEAFLDPKIYNFGFQWLRKMFTLSKQCQHIQALMEYSMKQFNEDEIMSKLNYGRVAKGTLTKDGKLAKKDSSGDIGLFCSELYKQLKAIHKDRLDFLCCNKVESLTVSSSDNSSIANVRTCNTDGGISYVTGDTFIVALGTGSSDICSTIGVQCPIFPVQGYLVTFSSQRIVNYNFELNGKAFVAPKGNGIYRLSGMADFFHSSHSQKESLTFSMGRVNELISLATTEFPDLKVIDSATCFRPLSPDDTPLIGKASKYNNLFLCSGHGSKGWTMGPGSGKLISSIIAETNLCIDAEPFCPSRFDIF